MAKYLPFGKELVATDEQMKARKEKFNQYEMYGIPYGILDDSCGEVGRSPIEQDRETARLLIMQGKAIPQDLSKRLLEHKQSINASKISKTKVSRKKDTTTVKVPIVSKVKK